MKNPDFIGVAKAWRLDRWKEVDTRPDAQACVAQYLIEGPFHPLWSQWVFCLVSLADIPGVKPAKKHHPDNTHEIMIISVDPKVKLSPDKIPDKAWALMPMDVVKQFKVPSNEDAIDLAEKCVIYMCNGSIYPDRDFRSVWNNLIDSKAEHYYGEHSTTKFKKKD